MAPDAVTVGVKFKLHAERLELHRDDGRGGAAGGRGGEYGKRERAARQEAGLFAFERDQVRLRQNLQQVILLQRFDGRADVQIGPVDKQVQQVGEIDR